MDSTPDPTTSPDENLVSQALRAVLDAPASLQETLRARDKEIEQLKASLKAERAYRERLRKKCEALEQTPCALDGWDEVYLFDSHAKLKFTVDFKTGQRRLSLAPRGLPPIRLKGDGSTSLLREAIQRANGRTRGSKEPETEA